MEIRIARQNEKEQIKMLWQICFNDIPKYADWIFDCVFKYENTVVVTDGERTISSAQMLPYSLNIQGEICPVSYIVGVSTLPEWRGRGIASKLMEEIKKISYSRGYVFNMLYPAIKNYYERFGFVPVSYHKESSFLPKSTDKFIYCKANFEDIGRLNDIYQGYMHEVGAYINRDEVLWRNILTDFDIAGGGAYFVCEKNGNVLGYLLYTKNKSKIRISEIAYNNEEFLKGVLGFSVSNKIGNEIVTVRLPLWERDIGNLSVGDEIKIASLGENNLGAMLQIVDRNKAQAIIGERITALNDAGFIRLFFEKVSGNKGNYINLAGWN